MTVDRNGQNERGENSDRYSTLLEVDSMVLDQL